MNYLSQQNQADFAGKKVILRLDLNVTLDTDAHVHDSEAYRIRAAEPTINWLKSAGAKIIIISHIGREATETLQPIADYMHIPMIKVFEESLLDSNQVIMLENLRQNPGEESNDMSFAQELAAHGDVYVNDAFAVSHRAHASIVGIPKLLPSYAGLQMEQEIENLSKSFEPPHPAVVIIGGAKFETKIPMIERLLPIADHIIIGGALANTAYRAHGFEIGISKADDSIDLSEIINNPKIVLPDRVIVVDGNGQLVTKQIADVTPTDNIIDNAPESFTAMHELFNDAAFVVWNGPVGRTGYSDGTAKIAELITQSNAYSILGGGDTVTVIDQLGIEKKFNFVSTGGGAMLEYLANGTLPGIDALA